MVVETVHKEFVEFSYNKYGKICDTPKRYDVDFEITYGDLNTMCKDLLKILKDKDVSRFWICHPHYHIGHYTIENSYFDLESVKKIKFEEYYLEIDGYKIFYNAIFDFGKAMNWR